eukprot:9096566-Lingulodinium_polyedra.AAC.1
MAVRRLQITLATQYAGAPRQTRVTAPLSQPRLRSGSQPFPGPRPRQGYSPSGVAGLSGVAAPPGPQPLQ